MAGYIGSKASVVSSGAERKKTFTITGATTSLTGLNYTVGKVHVFQNGVRLVDGTDYTATNSTTITLTVAAQSGDNVVVISQADFQVSGAVSTSGDTMTGDLTVQGAFTSQGIDDNGNATALTIDSSENVLVGKTTSDSGATAGFEVNTNGRINATRDGSMSGVFNRLTSDGDIVQFRKNGSNVGTIGTLGNYLTIGDEDTSIRFHAGVDSILPHNSTTNASRDASINLGTSTARFKDLYLSGGIHLGGTAAVNKLDSYEEGTWTPSFIFDVGGSGIVYGTRNGKYTRVGRTVSVTFLINVSSGVGTGDYWARLSGLPFVGEGGGHNNGRVYINNTNVSNFNLSVEGGDTSLLCFHSYGAANYAKGSHIVGQLISGAFTYFTSA
jgi:hypothetical protein